MPKFVRRQSLIERIKAYLDPADWVLYLSEELESRGWEQLEKEWAIPIGAALNVVFLIARANQSNRPTTYDDVFGEVKGTGWLAWLVSARLRLRVDMPSTNNRAIARFSRPPPVPSLLHERRVHILQKTALPPIRDLCRCHPKHAISPTSASRLFSDRLLASPLPVQDDGG